VHPPRVRARRLRWSACAACEPHDDVLNAERLRIRGPLHGRQLCLLDRLRLGNRTRAGPAGRRRWGFGAVARLVSRERSVCAAWIPSDGLSDKVVVTVTPSKHACKGGVAKAHLGTTRPAGEAFDCRTTAAWLRASQEPARARCTTNLDGGAGVAGPSCRNTPKRVVRPVTPRRRFRTCACSDPADGFAEERRDDLRPAPSSEACDGPRPLTVRHFCRTKSGGHARSGSHGSKLLQENLALPGLRC
jgi:hypothetical protein